MDSRPPDWKNKLYYGDNLDVMRQHIADESIDLVYLDPPFKSNMNYNLLFRADGLSPDEAQWTAFKDTWLWDEAAEQALAELQDVSNHRLVGLLNAFAVSIERSPMLAYIVNMALRLLEIHKKLKATGSVYLHCDPTASHYLKILLDTIFGPERFINEIIWKRTTAHGDSRQGARHFGRNADTIFFYTKGNDYFWNQQHVEYSKDYVDSRYRHVDPASGRRYFLDNIIGPGGAAKGNPIYEFLGVTRYWRYSRETMEKLYREGRIVQPKPGAVPRYKRYLDEMKGQPLQALWTDIDPINSQAKERLGYPTQKPKALLERIINASSNKGDLVLDPFCGCGTTIEAAQWLERRWIGIDISPFAIQLIRKKRLEGAFPELKIGTDYLIDGLPTTMDGAYLLAEQDKKAFEVWAVAQIDGIPNDKKGADKGIDGRIPFKPDGRSTKFAVVSVKGRKLKADDIRALAHVAKREKDSSLGFGIFVTLHEPTSGMRSDAAAAGTIKVNNEIFSLVQILTVKDILGGKTPKLPLVAASEVMKKAPMARQRGTQGELL